jgi:hypothetical protein
LIRTRSQERKAFPVSAKHHPPRHLPRRRNHERMNLMRRKEATKKRLKTMRRNSLMRMMRKEMKMIWKL